MKAEKCPFYQCFGDRFLSHFFADLNANFRKFEELILPLETRMNCHDWKPKIKFSWTNEWARL